eukprot:2030566-Lingulodinium_polyedra.AAC.1
MQSNGPFNGARCPNRVRVLLKPRQCLNINACRHTHLTPALWSEVFPGGAEDISVGGAIDKLSQEI